MIPNCKACKATMQIIQPNDTRTQVQRRVQGLAGCLLGKEITPLLIYTLHAGLASSGKSKHPPNSLQTSPSECAPRNNGPLESATKDANLIWAHSPLSNVERFRGAACGRPHVSLCKRLQARLSKPPNNNKHPRVIGTCMDYRSLCASNRLV